MKKTIIIAAAFAALTFVSCKKCADTERIWRCEITSYEYEGVSAPRTVTVPFTGTYNEKQQFELAHTFGNPDIEAAQECHCK